MTYEDILKHMRLVIASHAPYALGLHDEMVKAHQSTPPPAPVAPAAPVSGEHT